MADGVEPLVRCVRQGLLDARQRVVETAEAVQDSNPDLGKGQTARPLHRITQPICDPIGQGEHPGVGARVAQHQQQRCQPRAPVGVLDIGSFRDDALGLVDPVQVEQGLRLELAMSTCAFVHLGRVSRPDQRLGWLGDGQVDLGQAVADVRGRAPVLRGLECRPQVGQRLGVLSGLRCGHAAQPQRGCVPRVNLEHGLGARPDRVPVLEAPGDLEGPGQPSAFGSRGVGQRAQHLVRSLGRSVELVQCLDARGHQGQARSSVDRGGDPGRGLEQAFGQLEARTGVPRFVQQAQGERDAVVHGWRGQGVPDQGHRLVDPTRPHPCPRQSLDRSRSTGCQRRGAFGVGERLGGLPPSVEQVAQGVVHEGLQVRGRGRGGLEAGVQVP